ncbi:hypothetical protein OAP18_00860 [Gammaproteobacteria bacterium]|nr:hypothetical protein [Gammaproteobacteria bacterium]
MRVVTGFFVLSSLAVGVAQAQDYELPATYGEESLVSGFLPDPFTIDVEAGGDIEAGKLGSSCVGYIADAPDFELSFENGGLPLYFYVVSDGDTSLAINTPSGDWLCDDDSGGNLNPLVEVSEADSGVYDIWIGNVGESRGDYVPGTLSISELEPEDSLTQGSGLTPLDEDIMDIVETGELNSNDTIRENGAWQDSYSYSWNEGQSLVIDLRSDDFDTYLTVMSPSGESFVNDDFQDDTARSLLALSLSESGEYQVLVSSYESEEGGAYTFGIDTDVAVESSINTQVEGALSRNDETRSDGQYRDTYEFLGVPGRTVIIDLTSSNFDTYLILESPSGSTEENDDMDSTERSMIVAELAESGTYQVHVTSFKAGDTGDYSLSIEGESNNQPRPDPVNIALGEMTTGDLTPRGDAQENGYYQDHYTFVGNSGEYLQIELSSDEFDTLLKLVMPDGSEVENDDYEGSTEQSRIEFKMSASGEYRVIATSFEDHEIGEYRLMVNTSLKPFSGETSAAVKGASSL